MDEDKDFYIDNEEYQVLWQKCEQMLDTKTETYFDVYQFVELLDSYIDQGKLNKAYVLVGIAQKQHPNNTEIEYRKAKIHIERNDPEIAIEILKKLLKIEPENPDFHILIGIAYTIKKDVNQADYHFSISLDLEPEDEEDNLYNIAVTFLNYNLYENALIYLQKANSTYPENILVIYDLAYCYERVGDCDKSIDLYKKYIDLDPYSEYAWFNLALVYLRTDDVDMAIQSFNYAIIINENFSSAYFNKGNCLVNIERYEEAIESYEKLLQLEPDNAIAMVCIAECYEKSGDYEHAFTYFTKVTEIAPEYGEGWYGLGLIYFYEGECVQAKLLFEKTIELDPENDKYWISYGIVLKEINAISEALEAFKKATKLNKYEFEGWLQYSQLEYDLNNTNVAKKILTDALKYVQHPSIYYSLSAMYANEQDFTKALEYFEIAYSEDSELSSYFFDMCHIAPDKLELFHSIIFKK